MSKSNAATKTFAEQGLADVASETAFNEDEYVAKAVEGDEFDNLEQVSTLEPIELYFRVKPRHAGSKSDTSKDFILTRGDSIKGVFEGSFQSGEYSGYTFKIRLPNGKLGAIGSSQNPKNIFTADMLSVAEGSKVKITFQGMAVLKKGPGRGKEIPNFNVQAEKRIAK
jgi:hypothetical protein